MLRTSHVLKNRFPVYLESRSGGSNSSTLLAFRRLYSELAESAKSAPAVDKAALVDKSPIGKRDEITNLKQINDAIKQNDTQKLFNELKNVEDFRPLVRKKLHTSIFKTFTAPLTAAGREFHSAESDIEPISEFVVKIIKSGAPIGWMASFAIIQEVGLGNPEQALHIWVSFLEALNDATLADKEVNKEAARAALIAYTAMCLKNNVQFDVDQCKQLIPITRFPLDNELRNLRGFRLIPRDLANNIIKTFAQYRILLQDPSSVEFLKGIPHDKPIELESRYKDAQEHSQVTGNPLSATAYSRFIACSAESSRVERAFEIWNDMIKAKVVPTIQAWNSLLRAASLSRKDREALIEGVWSQIKESGVQPDAESYCILISSQFRNGSLDSALKMVDEIQKGNIPQVSVSLKMFNIVLDGLLRHNKIQEAEKLLKEGEEQGYTADVVVANTFIRSYIKNKQYDKATKTYENMMSSGVKPDVITYSNIIDTVFKLAKVQNISAEAHVEALLDEMSRRGIRLNTVAMTSIISGLIKTSRDIEASRLMFNIMIKKRIQLNGFVFATLINGELTIGDYDQALKYFQLMPNYNVIQSTPVFNQFIKWLSMRNDISRAYEMFRKLNTSKNTKPNKFSYYFILSGCLNANDKAVGQEIIDLLASTPDSFGFGTQIPVLLKTAQSQGYELPNRLLQLIQKPEPSA